MPLEVHPHVTFMKTIKTPEQRSPEWYERRKSLMTASNCAAAIGIKPFESFVGCPRQACIDQIVGGTFKGNVATRHGCEYEDHIRDLFDAIMGTATEEYGLLTHDQVHENGFTWLGASPDGITSCGSMVEIKAPYRRKIVPGEIPHHYFPQVQVQMEVCDLDLTYFVEWQPSHLSHNGKEILNIVPIERDRAWFEMHREALYKFFCDLQIARENYVPPPPPQCLIRPNLYENLHKRARIINSLFTE